MNYKESFKKITKLDIKEFYNPRVKFFYNKNGYIITQNYLGPQLPFIDCSNFEIIFGFSLMYQNKSVEFQYLPPKTFTPGHVELIE